LDSPGQPFTDDCRNMGFNRYRILLAVRLLIILGVMWIFPFAGRIAEPNQLVFTYLVSGLILLILVIELYFFLDRPLKEVRRFLEHIKNRDLSVRFNIAAKSRASKKLYRDFNEVLEVYQDIRIEKETQFRFLEHMVELIETGIVVFDAEGTVVLSNTAASELSGIPVLRSWKQVSQKNPDFAAAVGTISRSGKVLYEKKGAASAAQLMVQVSRTRMLDETYALMTMQDVSGAVEHKETGAWIRLLRTLNHEIKNSITPIGSLADTLMLILKKENGDFRALEDLTAQHLADLQVSAETLQQRSKSLYDFVNKYHQLTRIPPPEPEEIQCLNFLHEMITLLSPGMKDCDIRLKEECEGEELVIRADRGMLEQALINLVNNARDAMEEQLHPCIELGVRTRDGETIISVDDNGSGIPAEIMEDIYIPFFSTRKEGSGLGLPLVRQIMRLHGGFVSVTSKPGTGTSVMLHFPFTLNSIADTQPDQTADKSF
jgi:two-component system nitrogen regulation sensor histidine kinase NtrY